MIMKKYITIILAVLILLTMIGCSKNKQIDATTDVSPSEIARQIVEACGRDIDSFVDIHELFDAESLIEYVENRYDISITSNESISLYSADMPDAFEIAVFQFASDDDAANAVEKLTEYISALEEEFAFYEPEQAYIVHNSISVSSGCYAALLICEETSFAKETFENAISDKSQ